MTDKELEAVIQKARKRVAKMDAIDGGQQPVDELAGTAAIAIRSGMATAKKVAGGWLFTGDDIGCVADGVVYLEQLAKATGAPSAQVAVTEDDGEPDAFADLDPADLPRF